MSAENPKTVEEAVARMKNIADLVERNQVATTWRQARAAHAFEVRELAKQVEAAWKAEKAVLDARIAAAESRCKVGDKLEIDGIRMTVTLVKAGFNGHRRYHLVYFAAGDLKELEFDDGELDAMGAVKVEGEA